MLFRQRDPKMVPAAVMSGLAGDGLMAPHADGVVRPVLVSVAASLSSAVASRLPPESALWLVSGSGGYHDGGEDRLDSVGVPCRDARETAAPPVDPGSQ
jgi:hypothetical protein